MEKALFASWERHEIIARCCSAPLSPKPCAPSPSASYYPPHLDFTHSSDCSVYWWLKLAVSFRIHSQHWSSGTSGPNGLISTVYSCALSRMTHKGTKRPLCARELFLSSSTGPTDAHWTFLRKPSCLLSSDKRAVFSRGSLSARPLRLTILPSSTGGALPCHLSTLGPPVLITPFLLRLPTYPFILYSHCFPSSSSPNGLLSW